MNSSNAKDYLPLVQALAEGKVIQVSGSDGWEYWEDIEDVAFSRPAADYRIKPEQREIWVYTYKDGSQGPLSYESESVAHACNVPMQSRLAKYREVLE